MNKLTGMETWRGFQGCGAFNESFCFFTSKYQTKKHSSCPRKRKISPVLSVMLGGDSHERPERKWRESHGKAESEGRGKWRWERKQGIKGQSGRSKEWRNMGGVSVSVYVFPCPYRQHAHRIKAPLPQLHLANEKHCYTTLTATPLRAKRAVKGRAREGMILSKTLPPAWLQRQITPCTGMQSQNTYVVNNGCATGESMQKCIAILWGVTLTLGRESITHFTQHFPSLWNEACVYSWMRS